MSKWVFTGISGSGRIELLREVAEEVKSRGRTAVVHDVGELIRDECLNYNIPIVDQRILDLDHSQLRLLRAAALKTVELTILKNPKIDLHLIGIHSTFRWKGRLIPGVSFTDLRALTPDVFVNVVDDVETILQINKRNPKWNQTTIPTLEETQEWMIEEEFITEVLAEVNKAPVFLVARNHDTKNLTDLLLTKKKKIYLSYPITPVRESHPEILEKIQKEILPRLQDLFVVFNPLDIKDMPLTYQHDDEKLPELASQLTNRAKETIKSRTIERDFQFIDQSDAIVVLYMTDKLSPGVMAEIFYAHRNQTPVFMVMSGSRSPFIENATTSISEDLDDLLAILQEFAHT